MKCNCEPNKSNCGCKKIGDSAGMRRRCPNCPKICRIKRGPATAKKRCPRCEPPAENEREPDIVQCEDELEVEPNINHCESDYESDITQCESEIEPVFCEPSSVEIESEPGYCAVPWVCFIQPRSEEQDFVAEAFPDDAQDFALADLLTDELPEDPH